MQKYPEVEPRLDTIDASMTDDLLVEAELIAEQPKAEHTVFEPKELVAVPSAFEMIGTLVEMDRGDSQSVPPHKTVELAIPLTMTIAMSRFLRSQFSRSLHDENVETGKV